jgi:heme exporter protein CcmD
VSALQRLLSDPHGAYVLAAYGLAFAAMAGLGLVSALRLAAAKRQMRADP